MRWRKLDLEGKRFGLLTAVEVAGKNHRNQYIWSCICDCGKEKTILSYQLVNGVSKSCGCAKSKFISIENQTHGLSKHDIYKLWGHMVQRCEREKDINYKNYGGRGIKVCDEWRKDFIKFYEWALLNGYSKGLHIDRKDFNGNYDPANCQFITGTENAAIGKKRKHSNNTSGFTGVSFDKKSNKFRAFIQELGKRKYLGYFPSPIDAAEARKIKEIEMFGVQKTNIESGYYEISK